MILDYISNTPIKDSPKEQVRQQLARALFHECGISVDDMARDFPVKIDKRKKKIDIAIFESGAEHSEETLRRAVICVKEPKVGKKGVQKIRDHEQAKKEFELLHGAMATVDNCKYGLWSNGLELFYFVKKELSLIHI